CVLSAGDQYFAVGQQGRSVMAARFFHRGQLDESAQRWIVEFRRGNRFAQTVDSARQQDGVVAQNGRSQTGDADREPRRQGCERVARQAVNFSAGERLAGVADTADDQRLAARKRRGGVISARGVEIPGKRPYAGRLRRYRKRQHEDDEQRLQDDKAHSADATQGFAGILISRFHISPFPFPLNPTMVDSRKAQTALWRPFASLPKESPVLGN